MPANNNNKPRRPTPRIANGNSSGSGTSRGAQSNNNNKRYLPAAATPQKRGYPPASNNNNSNDNKRRKVTPTVTTEGRRLQSTAWLASTHHNRKSTERTLNNKTSNNNSTMSNNAPTKGSTTNDSSFKIPMEPNETNVGARVVSPVATTTSEGTVPATPPPPPATIAPSIADSSSTGSSTGSSSSSSSSSINNSFEDYVGDVTAIKMLDVADVDEEIDTDPEWVATLELLLAQDSDDAADNVADDVDNNDDNNNKGGKYDDDEAEEEEEEGEVIDDRGGVGVDDHSTTNKNDNAVLTAPNNTDNSTNDSTSTTLTPAELFLLQEPFSHKEFNQIEGVAKGKVIQAMDNLDQKGYSLFRDWRNNGYNSNHDGNHSSSSTNTQRQIEQQRAQQLKMNLRALQDAKIHGAPREYQQRLFEIACARNTIIHLGTGQGKTLIALMCIRHFATVIDGGGFSTSSSGDPTAAEATAVAPKANIESRSSKNDDATFMSPKKTKAPTTTMRKKQTLFLVPSVALAMQQGNVLRANLPYSVELAYYMTSTSAKARKALQDCNIIVATHGTMYELLMHYGDMFSLENFNLVVIDECHYCVGSHAYAKLMKRFYHTLPKDKRPHVVGLTASPLVRVKPKHTEEHLVSMLATLETNLNATVVSHVTTKSPTISSDDNSDANNNTDADASISNPATAHNLVIKSAEEKNVLYDAYCPRTLLPTLDNVPVHESRKRECQQIWKLYNDLGPLALSIYCQTVIREISRNSFEKETNQEFQALLNYLNHVVHACDRISRKCPDGGRSDKLLALEELLEGEVEERAGSDKTCIVFVERRVTALALHDFFRFRLKALKQHNWNRATNTRKDFVVREEKPDPEAEPTVEKDEAKDHAAAKGKRMSPTPSESSLSLSITSLASLKENATSNNHTMDQFADAESDEELGDMEIVNNSPVVVLSESNAVRIPPSDDSSSSAGSSSTFKRSQQFMDADDDDNKGMIQGYRSIVSEHVTKDSKSRQVEILEAEDTNSLPGFGDMDTSMKFRDDSSDGMKEPRQGDGDASASMEECKSVPSCNGGAEGKDTIRCLSLVRNPTNIFKSLNSKKQKHGNGDEEDEEIRKTWLHKENNMNQILGGLRNGEINVLIATSIVEEGVDVQACSCVVAFDNLRSSKAYVQMKGRARQKDATFYVFRNTEEAPNSTLSLDSAQQVERRVQHFIANRPSLSSVIAELDASRPKRATTELDAVEDSSLKNGVYRPGGKGGTCDLDNATSLVNRYLSSLPFDRTTKASLLAHLPIHSEHELTLPSHLPAELRVITLPKEYEDLPTKKEKLQVLSMIAIVRLHRASLLSARLLPLTRANLQESMLARIKEELLNIPIPRLGPFQKSELRTFYAYPLLQKNSRIDKLHHILRGKGHSLFLVCTTRLPASIPPMRVIHQGFGTVECSLGKERSVEISAAKFQIIAQFTALMFNSRWRRRSKGVHYRPKKWSNLTNFIPHTFVAAANDDQLQFAQMAKMITQSKRSEASRIEAVHSASDERGLPEPRLWAPLYDKNFTYISYGPSGKKCGAEFKTDIEKEGVDTFQDYFTKVRGYDVPGNGDSLLFDAQRLWVLPFNKAEASLSEDEVDFKPKIPESSNGHSKHHEICEDLRSLLLPKDACMEVPMADPNFLLLTTFLPQFLFHVQPYITADAFIGHSEKHMPRLAASLKSLSPEKVAQALTATSRSEEGSYEKLEWLGDAVLKMVQTDSLLYGKEFAQWTGMLHEGDLSTLRSVMGCNDRLATVCKGLKVDHFLLTSPLGRGQWVPSSLELYTPTTAGLDTGDGTAVNDIIPKKTRADVIEALLGIVYLTSGYDEASAVADELQVTLARDKHSDAPAASQIKANFTMLKAATTLTGHANFRRHDLVQEAFTHPTALHPETPSYQKLEWTGDAVLCLGAREWIYKSFPKMDVGQMVAMEASLVSNETLAYLSIKHGLLKNLEHCDQTLPGRIEYYEWCVQERKRGLWYTDPPKVAADVVEAVIGAVYMDGGFASGILAVNNVLSSLLPVLEKLYAKNSKLIIMHPRKALQEIGGNLLAVRVVREEDFALQQPKANVWLGRRWGTASQDGHRTHVGSVYCLGSLTVSILESSSEVAGNRACALAVAMLKKYPKLLSRVQEGRTLVESESTREEKQQKAKSKAALELSSTSAAMDVDEETLKNASKVAATVTNTEVPAARDSIIIDDMNFDLKKALLESVIMNVLDWL